MLESAEWLQSSAQAKALNQQPTRRRAAAHGPLSAPVARASCESHQRGGRPVQTASDEAAPSRRLGRDIKIIPYKEARAEPRTVA